MELSPLERRVLTAVRRRQQAHSCVHWRDVADEVCAAVAFTSDEVFDAVERLAQEGLLRMDAIATRPQEEGLTDTGIYVPKDACGLVSQLLGALGGGTRSRLSPLAA